MVLAKIKDKEGNIEREYYIDERLKTNLDKIKYSLDKKDKDYVLVVDGKEGTGKSTLAFQIGKYIDNSLNLKRVVFSPEDFREAILKAKKGQCIIYDEAFTGFSSRSSLSPVNRVLVSLAMQMRQKNLMVIIVLPTIFLLDKYIAMFRSNALVHVYESKSRRGYFSIYNMEKKKWLILRGYKTMSYKHKGLYTNFKGVFRGKFALGDEEVEKEYRKIKEKALSDSEKTSMSSAQVKYLEQRNLMIYLFRKISKMTYREMSEYFADYNLTLSHPQLVGICSKFGDIKEKIEADEEKSG